MYSSHRTSLGNWSAYCNSVWTDAYGGSDVHNLVAMHPPESSSFKRHSPLFRFHADTHYRESCSRFIVHICTHCVWPYALWIQWSIFLVFFSHNVKVKILSGCFKFPWCIYTYCYVDVCVYLFGDYRKSIRNSIDTLKKIIVTKLNLSRSNLIISTQ